MTNLPPTPLAPWLTHQASLTDKLKALTPEVKLQVLTNTWEKTHPWDWSTLMLPKNITVLHRDVVMHAEDTPCWYARTILPLSVYNAEEALFSRLKTEALGELIHSHPDIKRTNISPYRIRKMSTEYAYASEAVPNHPLGDMLWGRVSRFTLRENHTFYLLEVLLPGLLKYTDRHTDDAHTLFSTSTPA
jgi:chorismate lyase